MVFTACFLAVEFGAIWTGHNTLSETFWLALSKHQVLMTIALWVGLVALTGHFLASWWRG